MELRLSRSINQATKRDALILQGFRTKESPPQHLSLSSHLCPSSSGSCQQWRYQLPESRFGAVMKLKLWFPWFESDVYNLEILFPGPSAILSCCSSLVLISTVMQSQCKVEESGPQPQANWFMSQHTSESAQLIFGASDVALKFANKGSGLRDRRFPVTQCSMGTNALHLVCKNHYVCHMPLSCQYWDPIGTLTFVNAIWYLNHPN